MNTPVTIDERFPDRDPEQVLAMLPTGERRFRQTANGKDECRQENEGDPGHPDRRAVGGDEVHDLLPNLEHENAHPEQAGHEDDERNRMR